MLVTGWISIQPWLASVSRTNEPTTRTLSSCAWTVIGSLCQLFAPKTELLGGIQDSACECCRLVYVLSHHPLRPTPELISIGSFRKALSMKRFLPAILLVPMVLLAIGATIRAKCAYNQKIRKENRQEDQQCKCGNKMSGSGGFLIWCSVTW
jgi:hypothetical protein